MSLYYMCTFSLGNFTMIYRCRVIDQYCCGHQCCFKGSDSESDNLWASWYFWSLILVVFVVFGCIIVSFALSSIKQKADINNWSAFAGTAFNYLATTVIGRQGIIEPKLHYQPKNGNESDNDASENPETIIGTESHEFQNSNANVSTIVISSLESQQDQGRKNH